MSPDAITHWRARLTCGLAFGLVACGWCFVLPWVATWPSVAARIQRLDESGVDGGAMYYTELEAMKPILQKFHRGTAASR